MATVTFLVHPDRPDALALANDTAAWLKGRGDTARILRFSGPDRVDDDGVERALGAGRPGRLDGGGEPRRRRHLPAHRAPGHGHRRAGARRELRPARLPARPGPGPDPGALRKVFEGEATIESRCALEVSIADRSVSDDTSLLALNEVVIEKIDFGHTVRLATRIDGEEALTYSADGLIVATPTGSTAYNLSAGGPILAPTLRAMVVTPVAPHLSLDRSLVLAEHQEVRIEVVPDRAGALVIDGADVGRLQPGSVITCRVAAKPVRVVRNEPQTFGSILRFRLLADRPRR